MTKHYKYTCDGPTCSKSEGRKAVNKFGTWISAEFPRPRLPIETTPAGTVMERDQKHFCSTGCMVEFLDVREVA